MEHSTRNKYTLRNDVYIKKRISIPFSWESKPGLSKVTYQKNELRCSNIVLKPPPCSSSRTAHNKQIPVDAPNFTFCAVQSSSMRNRLLRLESQTEDPFLEAYKKCTQTPELSFMRKQPCKHSKSSASRPNIIKYMDIFSCKFSTDVISTVQFHFKGFESN
ncbi:hypothetical protein V8G54_008079 [Vigna mungo]|uniref:Uncharacterized protein n=1 Tax=Vigna mungo TaxID=3915 RepID=A0AAQ3P4Y9_VIGMU